MSKINRQLENWIYLACVMEATARKPGNVHPQASFHDLCYSDFLKSAQVIAPILANQRTHSTGALIKECIEETQKVTPSNSNLGIVLLLAPLVAVPLEIPISEGIQTILNQSTVQDSEDVYAAIRIANPGGLGKTESEDISTKPTGNLQEVMCLAASRDSIASEYAHNYRITAETAAPILKELWSQCADWEEATIRLQLRLMSEVPDTLIARKCGKEEAVQSSLLAREVLTANRFDKSLASFDSWLRKNGNQRNPGTTADLIVAGLFVAMRDGFIPTTEMSTIMKKIPQKYKHALKLNS